MKILRLTDADTTREDRSVWINFNFVEYIESRYDGDGKALGGARVYLINDAAPLLVEESAEDIVMSLSVMDNKPYNVGIAYHVNIKKKRGPEVLNETS